MQARAQATREHLLQHTVEALGACGYAGTSTAEVCRRASVSRGTLQYHFPTRIDLLVGALDHVLTTAVAEFVDEAKRDGLEPDALVGRMWKHWQGPALTAWLELAVAARTEPELREPMREVMAHFDVRIHAAVADIFGPDLFPGELQRTGTLLLFAILNGLSVGRSYEPPQQSDAILALAQHLTSALLAEQS